MSENYVNIPTELRRLILSSKNYQKVRFIFSSKIEDEFSINSLRKLGFSAKEQSILRNLFLDFIDRSIHMTITEFNQKYQRPTDSGDIGYDPEDGEAFETLHYGICNDKGIGKRVRLHGYYDNEGGGFFITRIDWKHQFHSGRRNSIRRKPKKDKVKYSSRA